MPSFVGLSFLAPLINNALSSVSVLNKLIPIFPVKEALFKGAFEAKAADVSAIVL